MHKLFALALCAGPLLAQEQVRYELKFPNAAHHEAEVRATFTGVRQPVLEVLMSRSSPGRYALHEFAKNVYHFHATDGQGRELAVTQPSPYQWNVSGHNDPTHAHLNLPATVVWAHGFEKTPVSLNFDLPADSGWKITTQLAPHPDGAWTAPNMDRMMDSPVEISNHYLAEWKVGDAQFRMALHHRGTDEEAAAFARLCQVVVTEEEGVFGAFPKYDNGNYTFLLDYVPYASGDGMEHRDSTVISGARDLKTGASQMVGTVAHEFFHSWNVKRIRPKTLEPFDYERADMSGELWFAEGFTNHYGPLTLKRAGLTDIDRFARSMGGVVSTVLTAPGRQVFNVVDMSRRAPFVDAATANDPVNTAKTFISYYTYGQALALVIDLSIRSRFPGKALDDWMRASRGGKKEVDLVLEESPALQLVPYELADKQLTPEITAFREAWLSSKAVHPLPKVVEYCPLCRRSHPFELDNCPYDGTALRITALKPGEEYTPEPPSGGRGGRRGGGL